MIIFYSNNIQNGWAELGEEESRHLLQALRRREGDSITFVDGKGGWYEGVISQVGKKNCRIQIQSSKQLPSRRPYRTHIAIAPTKNADRLEWFLEKATEIGIDDITPLMCRHSERTALRYDRLEKILLAAMKQSLQTFLPVLHRAEDFGTFVNQMAGLSVQKFIAFIGDQPRGHLHDLCQTGMDALVLIGPEGDFSPEEIALASASGFQMVSLGPNRLRTETAGVVAAHMIALKNDLDTFSK